MIKWDDLVYWQLIDEQGNKTDHQVIARDHAIRILDGDYRRNTLRELTNNEWADLRNEFHDSPRTKSPEKEEVGVELRKIEQELLHYIINSDDKVKSTKAFADKKGFSVETINDVATILVEQYLITTETEAGVDPKTQRSYISYRCNSTPIGKNVSERANDLSRIQNHTNDADEAPKSNKKRFIIDYQWTVMVVISFGILVFTFLNWRSNSKDVQHSISSDLINEDTIKKDKANPQIESRTVIRTLVDSASLPYLENYPILDKGLYLKYS